MPDLDRLKLAFAVSIAKEIVDADTTMDYSEFKLFGQIFPNHLLVEQGFVDGEGRFTEALGAAWAEARQVLPQALSREDKLDVLTIFYGASIADDELDSRELRVIREASSLLGISFEDLSRHLAEVRAESGGDIS
jgi:uncharacterized tellurite resistance protein B-like protein